MSYQDRNNYGGGRAVAPAQRPPAQDLRAPEIAMSDLSGIRGSGGVAIVPNSVREMLDIATMMASSRTAVRKHLRDNPGACFSIAMLAFRTGMDPYALANKSYEVNDQIAYEAQAIAAIIIKNAPIKDRPDYIYQGDGETRTCTVTVTTKSGKVLSYESPKKKLIKPQNSPLWLADPDQQLGYYSIRALARRHFPDVILGVYDVEEAESMKDVTPPTDQPAAVAAPKRSATAALDALQSRRGKAADVHHIEQVDEPAPEPEHDEDGVYHEAGEAVTVRGDDGELIEDEIIEPEAADAAGEPEIEIPQMPAETEALWFNSKRWSPGFKWIMAQAETVAPQVLAHLLMSYGDIVAAAEGFNTDGAAKVADLKKKAGL